MKDLPDFFWEVSSTISSARESEARPSLREGGDVSSISAPTQAVPSPYRANPGEALQDEEVSPSEAAQLKRTSRIRTPQSFGAVAAAVTNGNGEQKEESAPHNVKRSETKNDEPTPPKTAGSTPPKEEEPEAVAKNRRRRQLCRGSKSYSAMIAACDPEGSFFLQDIRKDTSEKGAGSKRKIPAEEDQKFNGPSSGALGAKSRPTRSLRTLKRSGATIHASGSLEEQKLLIPAPKKRRLIQKVSSGSSSC